MEVKHSKEVLTKEFDVWSTEKFEVKIGLGKVEKFKEKLVKKNKLGGFIVPEEEHEFRRIDYVQKRMRPVSSDCSGEDYDECKKLFLEKLFGV